MLMFTVLNLIKLPLTKSFSLKIGCKKYNLSSSVYFTPCLTIAYFLKSQSYGRGVLLHTLTSF